MSKHECWLDCKIVAVVIINLPAVDSSEDNMTNRIEPWRTLNKSEVEADEMLLTNT